MIIQTAKGKREGIIKRFGEFGEVPFISHHLSAGQYFREVFPKKQIVFHHTVSGPGAQGDRAWWEKTKDRIATAFIVDSLGVVWELMPSIYWAHHLGIKRSVFEINDIPIIERSYASGRKYAANNIILNQHALGIELDSWGALVKSGGIYHPKNYPNVNVPLSQVDEIHYRGYKYFQKYTELQLKSSSILAKYYGQRNSIDLSYNYNIFRVNRDALMGKNGVWSHTSFRLDKSDCYPQEAFINMLKSLK